MGGLEKKSQFYQMASEKVNFKSTNEGCPSKVWVVGVLYVELRRRRAFGESFVSTRECINTGMELGNWILQKIHQRGQEKILNDKQVSDHPKPYIQTITSCSHDITFWS